MGKGSLHFPKARTTSFTTTTGTHDAAGNMTTLFAGNGYNNPSTSLTAKYDAWNRLVAKPRRIELLGVPRGSVSLVLNVLALAHR